MGDFSTHIYFKANGVADALVRLGMLLLRDVSMLDEPPSNIHNILSIDALGISPGE